MKHPISRSTLALLLLLAITGCGGHSAKTEETAPAATAAAQSAPEIPELPGTAGWPADEAPAELPEYTSGTVTASAVDGNGVLGIRVKDTNQTDLHVYLGQLQDAGWIVSSDEDEAEARLGLYTVRFALQGGGSFLQIDVYTQEAGSWPADEIPPDILEPATGTLAGRVEVLETIDNAWYFNYTYDGMDEAGAREYMRQLAENGWSGEGGQLYKSFQWKGERYAADIEIYETVETRTTFTCNFYLSGS